MINRDSVRERLFIKGRQEFSRKETAKICDNCEFYMAENSDGYPLNWCSENDSSTTADDCCDSFSRE